MLLKISIKPLSPNKLTKKQNYFLFIYLYFILFIYLLLKSIISNELFIFKAFERYLKTLHLLFEPRFESNF